MIIQIGNRTLKLKDQTEEQKARIQRDTPQHSFIRSHWGDIQRECRALSGILSVLSPLESVADLMAGSGFSGSVFLNHRPETTILLNDMDPVSAELLKSNFPLQSVTCQDIKQIEIKLRWDMIFLDFNNFTLHKSKPWRDSIERLAHQCKYLLITDSACFGFRMGNLKHYKCQTAGEYYDKLGLELAPLMEQKLMHYCVFGPAALVLFGPEAGEPLEIGLNERLAIYTGRSLL